MQRARKAGLLRGDRWAIIDSTGLETNHASQYYRRINGRGSTPSWPKITVVCHSQSHLFITADIVRGPCPDFTHFPKAVRSATRLIKIHKLLADKGYDSEQNHVLCNEELKIPSTIIAIRKNNKGSKRWPRTYYRRRLYSHFPKKIYGQRWQVESAFSRTKRRLGSWLLSRKWETQVRECHLKVLTHNLLIVGARIK